MPVVPALPMAMVAPGRRLLGVDAYTGIAADDEVAGTRRLAGGIPPDRDGVRSALASCVDADAGFALNHIVARTHWLARGVASHRYDVRSSLRPRKIGRGDDCGACKRREDQGFQEFFSVLVPFCALCNFADEREPNKHSAAGAESRRDEIPRHCWRGIAGASERHQEDTAPQQFRRRLLLFCDGTGHVSPSMAALHWTQTFKPFNMSNGAPIAC